MGRDVRYSIREIYLPPSFLSRLSRKLPGTWKTSWNSDIRERVHWPAAESQKNEQFERWSWTTLTTWCRNSHVTQPWDHLRLVVLTDTKLWWPLTVELGAGFTPLVANSAGHDSRENKHPKRQRKNSQLLILAVTTCGSRIVSPSQN